ncbi:hypothetical protein ABVK25_003756 [Lepraria finkii]|uniref:Uncharacterized protein n=1 Tax=Lepraria finkii TaxID=1340010 RepID=A0ABR4BE49_9LECA
MQFATLARYYLAQVAEGQGNPFDQYRTTQAFNVFQGTFGGETTPEDRLNKILGGKVNEEVEIERFIGRLSIEVRKLRCR